MSAPRPDRVLSAVVCSRGERHMARVQRTPLNLAPARLRRQMTNIAPVRLRRQMTSTAPVRLRRQMTSTAPARLRRQAARLSTQGSVSSLDCRSIRFVNGEWGLQGVYRERTGAGTPTPVKDSRVPTYRLQHLGGRHVSPQAKRAGGVSCFAAGEMCGRGCHVSPQAKRAVWMSGFRHRWVVAVTIVRLPGWLCVRVRGALVPEPGPRADRKRHRYRRRASCG